MKFLISVFLLSFVVCAGAEREFSSAEHNHIFVKPDGANYVRDESGNLVPAGMVIIGEENLGKACLAGRKFDQETAGYDSDKEDLYYTIVNHANAQVVVSITTADQEGMFCSTPFRILEKGECLKVYEDDRLQSLASIKVGDETLCDGWTDQSQKKCVMGNSYEIKTNNLVEVDRDYDYFSTNFRMKVSNAVDRTDCQQIGTRNF